MHAALRDGVFRDPAMRVVAEASNKRSSPQALPPDVAARVAALPRIEGDPCLLASRDDTTQVCDLDSTSRTIRETAKVPDARMNDLRRTIATEYAASGASELHVQQLLGHVTTQAARHYVHLARTQEVARDFLAQRATRLRAGEGATR